MPEIDNEIASQPNSSQSPFEKPPFRLLTRQGERYIVGSSSFRRSPHPKALGKRHLNLRLVGTPLGFAGRAPHPEPTRRTPAKHDAADFTFVVRFRTDEGVRLGGTFRVSWLNVISS